MGPELTTAISWAHLGSSVVAVISGPLVLLLRKGDRRHRRIGHVYVWSMVVLNATAFLIYRLLYHFALQGRPKMRHYFFAGRSEEVVA